MMATDLATIRTPNQLASGATGDITDSMPVAMAAQPLYHPRILTAFPGNGIP